MATRRATPQGYGPFLCKSCNVRFASSETLMKHKADKRAKGSDTHIHCRFCGVDFATEQAEILHIRQDHPHAQELECPGCGHGPFRRVAQLMAHIEFGDCARISLASIEAIRDKKQEFPQKLEAITRMPVKGNYTGYMPSTLAAYDQEPPWEQEEEEEEQNLLQFEKDDFPGLPGQGGESAAERQAKTEAESILSASEPAGVDKENLAWTKKTNLFPNAAPAQAPTKEQLKEVTTPSARQKHDYLDPDDPDHPYFNPARYFCRYSETFTCPRTGCGKGFKTAGGLIAHLRSPAHGTKTYTCPYCYKRFKTLAAVTAHSESSSLRCNIRSTDGYDAYMDQLTGGIIDVDLDRHEDGTLRYKTSEAAWKTFGSNGNTGGQAVKGEAKVKMQPADDYPW